MCNSWFVWRVYLFEQKLVQWFFFQSRLFLSFKSFFQCLEMKFHYSLGILYGVLCGNLSCKTSISEWFLIRNLFVLKSFFLTFQVEANKYGPIYTERKNILLYCKWVLEKGNCFWLLGHPVENFVLACSSIFGCFQVISENTFPLLIFVLGFIWWWDYQSLFYILSCPLFSFKLVKVVSGWLHCCGSRITEWHQPLKQSWPPAKWKLFLFSSLRCSLVAFSCLIRRNLCPFSSYVFGKVGDISKDMETFVYKFIKQIWYLVLTADNYCMFNPQYA